MNDLLLHDLLEELGAKNRVRVVKYAALRPDPHGPQIRRKVLDELSGPGTAFAPALVLADELRVLSGRKPIYLDEVLRRLGGDLRSVTENLRTNVGINFVAANVAGTDGGQVSQADWIAISNNTSAPAAGDSSSTAPWSTGVATDGAAGAGRGEWTGLGLTRKLATMAHTANATTYTATASWTATGASTSSQMAGLFGGAGKTAQGSGATNILVLENIFTATSLVTNDVLQLTWTVTF